LYEIGELVDALTGIVSLGIHIVSTKVPPLEPVDGAEIANGPVSQAEVVEELS
jgi:hypothetical protein